MMETREVLFAVIAVAALALVADLALLGDPAGLQRIFATATPAPTPLPTPAPTPTPTPLPKATITELANASCAQCFNISRVSNSLVGQSAILGLDFTVRKVEADSVEGIALISQYNITKVPTILLSEEAGRSPGMLQAWNGSGTVERDGVLVLREAYPPYFDLSNGTLAGNVTIINLFYEPCAECYNVTQVKSALEVRYGVSVFNEASYSFNTTNWNETVAKYNITRVPTVVVSPELALYPGVEEIWLQELGTMEPDGWFVFRTMDVSGATYYDLLMNSTVSRMD